MPFGITKTKNSFLFTCVSPHVCRVFWGKHTQLMSIIWWKYFRQFYFCTHWGKKCSSNQNAGSNILIKIRMETKTVGNRFIFFFSETDYFFFKFLVASNYTVNIRLEWLVFKKLVNYLSPRHTYHNFYRFIHISVYNFS